MKKRINIKYQNGINKQIAEYEIFNELLNEYEFVESEQPDFILFGPYGNDVPQPGNYIRIGYFSENMQPDMSVCEWAFGIPLEKDINHPNYKRIQWHGLDPQTLVKPDGYDAEAIYAGKKHFCNFLYSHKIPYREEFVKQLSKYKKVDAPGLSMNNMNSIDTLYKGNFWERKRQFLGEYKFTIAFENYVYPGYQTEKLYDAMQANSIPIYCGDPDVGTIFNTDSFINATDYISTGNTTMVKWLEKNSQQDFIDMRPAFYTTPANRIKRKLKAIGRQVKMDIQFKNFDLLIQRIIEIDQDKSKYIQMLNQPWFKNNTPPQNASSKSRWIEIFDQDK